MNIYVLACDYYFKLIILVIIYLGLNKRMVCRVNMFTSLTSQQFLRVADSLILTFLSQYAALSVFYFWIISWLSIWLNCLALIENLQACLIDDAIGIYVQSNKVFFFSFFEKVQSNKLYAAFN